MKLPSDYLLKFYKPKHLWYVWGVLAMLCGLVNWALVYWWIR